MSLSLQEKETRRRRNPLVEPQRPFGACGTNVCSSIEGNFGARPKERCQVLLLFLESFCVFATPGENCVFPERISQARGPSLMVVVSLSNDCRRRLFVICEMQSRVEAEKKSLFY